MVETGIFKIDEILKNNYSEFVEFLILDNRRISENVRYLENALLDFVQKLAEHNLQNGYKLFYIGPYAYTLIQEVPKIYRSNLYLPHFWTAEWTYLEHIIIKLKEVLTIESPSIIIFGKFEEYFHKKADIDYEKRVEYAENILKLLRDLSEHYNCSIVIVRKIHSTFKSRAPGSILEQIFSNYIPLRVIVTYNKHSIKVEPFNIPVPRRKPIKVKGLEGTAPNFIMVKDKNNNKKPTLPGFRLVKIVYQIIEEREIEQPEGVSLEEIRDDLREYNVSKFDLMEALQHLKKEGSIFEPRPGVYKTI